MDARVLATLGFLLLAGCTGPAEEGEPTSSPPPLPPVQLKTLKVDACPAGADPPVQNAPRTATFEVKPGYDQIVVAFHASGAGQGGGEVRWVEESMVVWSRPSNKEINSPPCPSHSHSGDGDIKKVEPGNYTMRVQYAGAVAIHFEVTAISSKANASASPSHSHVPVRWND